MCTEHEGATKKQKPHSLRRNRRLQKGKLEAVKERGAARMMVNGGRGGKKAKRGGKKEKGR